jgi:hypothetical protein
MIIAAGRLGEQLCCSQPRMGFSARTLPKNPLQFAVLAARHRAELQLPSPLAQAVAGPAARALAIIGWAVGFRPDGIRAVRAR